MTSRCQCRLPGPADMMLGAYKDPISSEKCWLDFTVRELSRVAAGKGRGQEAVWRAQCKPAWWASVCPHAWKNPTANPKDCKDTLKSKFECLVGHLRNEGTLPGELQKEVALWEAGRVNEIFQRTALSSLLGQASNFHAVLQDTVANMQKTGITVQDQACILASLRSCLSACVDMLSNTVKSDSLSTSDSDTEMLSRKTETPSVVARKPGRCSGRKHQRDESHVLEDMPQPPCKRFKPSPTGSPSSSASSLTSASSPISSSSSSSLSSPPPPSSSLSSPPPPSTLPSSSSSSSSLRVSSSAQTVVLNPEQKQVILALLQKQLLEKQGPATAAATTTAAPEQTLLKKKAVVNATESVVPAAVTGSYAEMTTLSDDVVPYSALPEIESSDFPDFFNLDLEEVNDLESALESDFKDQLLHKSTEIFSESLSAFSSEYNTTSAAENISHPENFSSEERLELFAPISENVNSFSNSDPLLSYNFSTTASDSESPQGVFGDALRVSIDDIESIEEECSEECCESGYNSEGSNSISIRSSLDSDSNTHSPPAPDSLEAFLDSLGAE